MSHVAPKERHRPQPQNNDPKSLGETQPAVPFSLMTFTYPVLLLIAMFLLGFFFWVM